MYSSEHYQEQKSRDRMADFQELIARYESKWHD